MLIIKSIIKNNLYYLKNILSFISFFFDGYFVKFYKKQKLFYYKTFYGVFCYSKFIIRPEKFISQNYNIFFKYYIPKKKDIVIELGSGIGTETLLLSKLVGDKGKVYAIEADPEIFKLLKKNINENNLKNVTLLNFAITNKRGIVNFTQSQKLSKFDNWLGNLVHKNGKKKIKSISLMHIIKKYKIKKINFLKCNIEGSEYPVIKSFFKSPSNIVINWCVSCHDFLKIKKMMTMKKIIKIFLKNNYKIKRDKLSYFIFGKYYLYAKFEKKYKKKLYIHSDKNHNKFKDFFKKIK